MGEPSPHLFFYSVFVSGDHLPQPVTWRKVILPVFSGECSTVNGAATVRLPGVRFRLLGQQLLQVSLLRAGVWFLHQLVNVFS